MSILSRLAVAMAAIDLDTKKLFRNLLAVNVVGAAGSTQGDATGLTAGTNIVTGADATKGVVLPPAEIDMHVSVFNTVSGQTLKVYPNVGAQCNAIATDGAFSQPGLAEAQYHCDAGNQAGSGGHWYGGAGAAGAQGAQGAQGATGAQGAQGPQGPQA